MHSSHSASVSTALDSRRPVYLHEGANRATRIAGLSSAARPDEETK
jgi:hypothetical protein